MANGTALTVEELRKLGQGAADFKASIPMSAGQANAGLTTPVKTAVPMVGPVLPGTDRPMVTPPVSAGTASQPPGSVNGTLQGPYANPNGGYQAGLNVVDGKPQYNQPTASVQGVSAGQASPPPDYAAMAASRTAAALQNKRTIAQQQKASADTSYQQQALRTKDDRVLSDFSRTQTAGAFSNMGRKTFTEGLIGRERTQADADAAASLATQKGNIDALLADYENATYDEQLKIADELEWRQKNYDLQLAQVTGNINGQQTLESRNADRNFNQNQQVIDYNQDPNNPSNIGQGLQNTGQAQQNLLNQYKIDSYPEEQKAAATKVQQELALGKMDVATAEYNFKQLKDPNSTYNQAAKIDLDLKKIDFSHASEKARLEIQQLQKQIAQIGVVHYKPQTPAEIAQDEVTLKVANKQLEDIKKGIYPGDKPAKEDIPKAITAEEYQKNLTPKYDPHGVLTNGQQLEDQILLSGMDEWNQYKAYVASGIQNMWTDPVPKKPS